MSELYNFNPLSKLEFYEKYSKIIRVLHELRNVPEICFGQRIVDMITDTRVNVKFVHYSEDKNFFDGEQHLTYNAEEYSETVFLRAPAAYTNKAYYLLDGNHRVRYYSPRLLFLDVIDLDCIEQDLSKYFLDTAFIKTKED